MRWDAGLLEQVVDQAQHLDAPAAGRDRAVDTARVAGAVGRRAAGTRSGRMQASMQAPTQASATPALRMHRRLACRTARVKDGADAVAVAREQAGDRGDEVDQLGALERLHRAEIHRGAQVEQEPGGDLAVFDVLADVGGVHARRDVPVDIADVVARLVLAQVGKVDAVAVEEAAVVALQQAVEPADHLPVEAQQDALGRGLAQRLRRRSCGQDCRSWPRPTGYRQGCAPALCRDHALARRRVCSCSGTSGMGIRLRIFLSRSSALTSSDSASYESTRRCRITSSAMSSTSCGSA